MNEQLANEEIALLAPEAQALDTLRAHVQKLRASAATLRQAATELPRDARRALGALEAEVGSIEELLRKLAPPASMPLPFSSGAADGPLVKPKILIADDDRDTLELLGLLLSELYAVTAVDSGDAALAQLLSQHFSLAILDVQLPNASGFELAERLHERTAGAQQPIMYLSGQASPQFKTRGLSLGAADYMTKPFDSGELLARVARIIATGAREESLRLSALTDRMTGLANYRAFIESLEREFARSQRYGQPLCVLTIDLDGLKAINDSGGHEAGNEAIRQVAAVLKDGVRKFELVSRQGGDEFSVLLPNTSEQDGLLIAERLRLQISRTQVLGTPLTVSVGLGARARGSDCTLQQLVGRSDEALYRAKRTGRNRVAVSSDLPRSS